jgi:Flp pilus assembly protein TadG
MRLTTGCLPAHQRRGTVALLVAVCLTLLLAIIAIALDGGALFSERRHAQAVADAAGQAAACDLYSNYAANQGTDPSGSAANSALATAAANGYANDGTSSVVTVNIPPKTGDYNGLPGYAEVVVQYNQQRSFSSIFSSAPIPVRARSVVRGADDPYTGAAILVLDPSAQQALSLSWQVSVTTNAPVKVDSTSNNAVAASGSSKLTAPTINICGAYTTSNSASLSGPINEGGAPRSDPLANLLPPDPLSLPLQSGATLWIQGTSGQTLSPGLYKGGISIRDQASVTLLPGIYYIQGGQFSVADTANLTGVGVMIYSSPLSGDDEINGLSMASGGTISLSPPTSGPYRGITFFQDRACNMMAWISAGPNTNITGTFYVAGAWLAIQDSGTGAVIGSQYICRQLSLTGSGSFSVTWDANKVARHRGVYLVE